MQVISNAARIRDLRNEIAKRDELLELQEAEKLTLHDKLDEVVVRCNERVRQEVTLNRETQDAAESAIRKLNPKHADEIQGLNQDVDSNSNSSHLVEQIEELRRAQDVFGFKDRARRRISTAK